MPPSTLAARNAVGLAFFLNGFLFASWISRIPETREALDLSNSQLGLLLLAIAAGSVVSMPTTAPTLKAAWNRGITVRPRCCSTAAPSTFIDTSQTPVPMP